MPSLSDFEQDYQKSISAQDLEKEYSSSSSSSGAAGTKDYLGPSIEERKLAPPPAAPGLPPDIQQRFERPFGLPRMPVAPAGMAIGGTGVLGGALGQGAAAGGEALVQGKGPLQAGKEALGGALGGGVLGGIGKGVSKIASALDLPALTEKIGSKIADKLRSEVPAWEKMKSLKDMLYTQKGINSLHQAYDDSFNTIVKKATGNMLEMPVEDAKALGIKNYVTPKQAITRVSGTGMDAPALVQVDAGDVVKGVQGKWSKDPQLYRRVTDQLDQAGFSDPAARKAYKTAIGLRTYLDKTGALRPDGTLDLMKAQKGLTQAGKVDSILKRDLGDYLDLLTPGGKTLSKGSLAGPFGVIGGALGGAGGAVGGHAAGPLGPLAGAPLGAGFGAYHGAKIGRMIPTYNIQGPVQNFLQQLMSRGGGAAGAGIAQKMGE